MPHTVLSATWFTFVEESAKAQTREEVLDSFGRAVMALGFDMYNVSLIRDFDFPASHLGFGLKTTYPDDWQKYYADRNCVRFDPVANLAKGYVSPFYWSEIDRLAPLTSLQKSFLSLAGEAGLNNGIGLPFMGPTTLIGGVALATSSQADEHLKDLNSLWAFSSLLYRRLKELALQHGPPAGSLAGLTPREIDILQLASHGITDRELGRQLAITENTVNSHFRKIFEKLGVNNRIHAISCAVRLNLINPT